MTFKQLMIKAMTSRGMFQSQAKEIIEKYIVSDEANPMMDRWHDDTSEYPEALQNFLWMGVKDYAAKWVIENAPEAWFRPMFEFSEKELQQMMKERDNRYEKTTS